MLGLLMSLYEWVGSRIKWIVSVPTFLALVLSTDPGAFVFVPRAPASGAESFPRSVMSTTHRGD